MSNHNRTITEAKVHQLSALKYGVDPIERTEKLKEEVIELELAEIDYLYHPTEENKKKVVDELSDSLFVLISKFSEYDTNIRELVDMAIHKIKQREIDPNYKR